MYWRTCNKASPTTALLFPGIRSASRICDRLLLFNSTRRGLTATAGDSPRDNFLLEYRNSLLPNNLDFTSFPFPPNVPIEKYLGKTLFVHGFLGHRRDLSQNLSFFQLALARKERAVLQVISRVEDSRGGQHVVTSEDVHKSLKSIKPLSAVSISGVLEHAHRPKKTKMADGEAVELGEFELVLQSITCRATFPDDIVFSKDARFGPENRHLQLRFHHDLHQRLLLRDHILRQCRFLLPDFTEIETPILFKSTPEGAREFLVPTRRPGYAYALPQSPQQYKQILIAGGIDRYFQIAKCFRDEDLRADRQPEFTQLDLEMAFYSGERVMQRIETLIIGLFKTSSRLFRLALRCPNPGFPRMTYHEAMQKHGSDKPDLRIPDEIQELETPVFRDLVRMLTSLPSPVVDCWRFRSGLDPSAARAFVKKFMDSPEATTFRQNPNGAPGIFMYDPHKPLDGLQAFGHEGAEALRSHYVRSIPPSPGCGPEHSSSETLVDSLHVEAFQTGDVIIVQARPAGRLSGGSTALGRLRAAIYRAAIAEGIISIDKRESHFLWVTDFPMFTPNNETDPGQGGGAGFSATHHPFTAPKTAVDVDLLLTNPLEAIADHYDLVVNGVELGGGSKRIHNSEMQQFVMGYILQMSDERLKDFSHLFEALRAGCPPHAGIALGLDRLIAVMMGVDSVRDVIAFPKSGRGEDLLVKSPSRMTTEQLKTYHLNIVE